MRYKVVLSKTFVCFGLLAVTPRRKKIDVSCLMRSKSVDAVKNFCVRQLNFFFSRHTVLSVHLCNVALVDRIVPSKHARYIATDANTLGWVGTLPHLALTPTTSIMTARWHTNLGVPDHQHSQPCQWLPMMFRHAGTLDCSSGTLVPTRVFQTKSSRSALKLTTHIFSA